MFKTIGLSEEIKAEIESQLETFKKELKKELQSLFNQRTTDTINGVEEKYMIMSSGMTEALSAATIKFDNATKLISGVTVIDKLDQYGITVDNIHQILDTNRKAFSGFTQSATTLFKKLQEDVESGITFAVSSVSGIIRTNIESGLTSAITEANAQLFDQSKEFTNGVFANASAFTLSKFNEVSSNLGSLSGDVRGLASGFTELNNQFVFYTPTSAMSGVVLNITNDKFVKQNDFGEYSAATESALTKYRTEINDLNSNFTNINGQINDHGTNIETLDTQLKSFSATVESITGKVSTIETNIEGFNNKFSTIEGDYATKVWVAANYAPLTSVQGFENRIGGLEGAVPQLNERVTTVEGKVSSLNETVSTGENNLLDRVNVIEEEYATKTYVDNAIGGIDLAPYLKTEDAKETYATKDFVNNKLVDYAPLTSVQGFENRIGGLEGAVPQLNERVSTIEDMNTDFILERVDIGTIKEKGQFMTENDIDSYIRKSKVLQEVIGNNYVSKNEFISFSGTVSNKIDIWSS